MTLITRAQWGARPSRGAGNALGRPKGVAIHWEGPKIGSRPHAECFALVRGIQAFHQDGRGWADIAYNLLVCEHGGVFEGRGVHRGSAANGTTQGNLDYHSICALVGRGDPQPTALFEGVKEARQLCLDAGVGKAVVGHRDLVATTCPGDELYSKLDALRTVPARVVRVVKAASRKAVRTVTRAPLVVDGVMGPATIRQWQKVMGTVQDGVISEPSLLVRAVQRRVGVADDGLLGPITWKAIQRRLGVAADGVPGRITIRALQKRLNTGKF